MCSQNRTIWDYLILPENERDRIAALGREGWELVGIGGSEGDRLLYFKRAGRTFREHVTLEQRRHCYASLGREADGAEREARS